MIGIIDYGVGNLRSIETMFDRVGVKSVISGDLETLRRAEKLILPGVGHFRFGMEQLRARGLVESLNQLVQEESKPILGICLGAQLLGRGSEEGPADGLGWVPMDTVAFDRSRLSQSERVPHMGWADTEHTDNALFSGLSEPSRFYYVHSFHFRCDDPAIVTCSAVHGYRFASGVAYKNVMGVQFHPEKSHGFGRQVLKNFATMPVGK
jgi:glutamine amidotransferase